MSTFHRRGLLAAGASAIAAPSLGLPSVRTWTFDSLESVGGQRLTLEGRPRLIAAPGGKAILFDGVGDAVFINEHPLAGAQTFTAEAIFRPDGGAFEQRWLHLESAETPAVAPGKGATRMLFEIRVVESRWYLDAFMTGPGYKQAMMVPSKLFPVGRWHHVAQTYDGQTYRSFVDGELQMEVATAFTPQASGKSSIGTRLNRVAHFNGAVREARFTHQALSPAQFTRL